MALSNNCMQRIIFIQPALPSYRINFFDRLWQFYGDKINVYFSPTNMGALTDRVIEHSWARRLGQIRQIAYGFYWQEDASSINIEPKDIVVLSGNPRQLSTLVLLAKARFIGAKTIWWGHYWSSTSRVWRQLIRQIPMTAADALLFYTDLEVAEYRETHRGIIDPRPVVALNNGLDIEPIVARRAIFIPQIRDNALIFIGRLTEKANLNLGLEALHVLGSHAPHLHILGDGEEGSSLKAYAVTLGISERITWHGGTVDEERIAAVANICKAFLYPGEVGLSLIHAMAYGLPAIVHNNRWRHMPEIAAFIPGETGVSFESNNVASLTKCINDTFNDDDKLMHWSQNACRVTLNSFNTVDMSKRFIALVDQLQASS
ncbi:glycosyltransferase family 4 protein [Allochromatium humboldtianum]|uniref:Glycosyltransferase family 4 protein n=1 Tax=Allochromatium humboldtianum TaxID=504901 RepID=A0A850R0J4_9GAMM|nr:glycosyltransferase [Allochromatium humboldtianum]NVZ08089.1 glycosyltransferase family 4 protein [Allochromatium humboldtianum]